MRRVRAALAAGAPAASSTTAAPPTIPNATVLTGALMDAIVSRIDMTAYGEPALQLMYSLISSSESSELSASRLATTWMATWSVMRCPTKTMRFRCR
jgi:hypothetical protein